MIEGIFAVHLRMFTIDTEISSMDKVCSGCIGDSDVKRWIASTNGARGCDYCGGYTSPTVPLEELCDYLESGLGRYYGAAVDQLPWNGRDGGYQGTTWSTDEILFDRVGLNLPRDDDGRLQEAITWGLSDEVWCDYDWMRLDEDEAMKQAWDAFCSTVKHQRRFFFHHMGGSHEDLDSFSSLDILTAIAQLIDTSGLIRVQTPGLRLYRARPNFNKRSPAASDFGPPPRDVCQSNRMNPAGVPMFYGALDPRTAVKEVRESTSRVGYFITETPLTILDLTRVPPIPGFFSDATRHQRLHLRFLHYFIHDIMQPVARDDRIHTDYVPSQVVTEFLREHAFEAGSLDGIMYGSVVAPGKSNLVLFIDTFETQSDFLDCTRAVPLRFLGAKTVQAHPKAD